MTFIVKAGEQTTAGKAREIPIEIISFPDTKASDVKLS